MNFAEPFIRRPVATTLLVTTILIFGVMGYRLLPVSDLPTRRLPTIQVQANLPGASPETMAASVATPLEKQFSTIAGVTSISSNNGQGNTNITLQFDLEPRHRFRRAGRAVDDRARGTPAAARHAVAAVVPEGESGRSADPVPDAQLADDAAVAGRSSTRRSVLAQRLSMVSGVAQVNVFGAQKFAVRIDVDPTQLAARQIGIDQVAQAIAAANVNRPTGTLYGPAAQFRRPDQRPADGGRRVPPDRRRLP